MSNDLFSVAMQLATDVGPLRAALHAEGGSISSLTVLAPQNDPFRVDTDSGHRDGSWLANSLDQLGVDGQRHLRGLHYVLIGHPKPNGQPYTNTEKDWLWLGGVAKSARWLGYIPFNRIVDQRNDEPVVTLWSPPSPTPYVSVDFEIQLPDADDLTPQVRVADFSGAQPYHLVLVGEKSSLRPVLSGVADRYKADLYLPTGEISDTQAYLMARSGAEDGRPMVVLYFSDCDPSGWQMPVSLSRKLQGLTAIEFDDLQWQIHRVGLLPDQVREYGLPSTPLKDTEKRADKWTAAMGVQQTEIDTIAAQPELLRQIADDAVAPFFDRTLDRRVTEVRRQWLASAQRAVDEQAGGDQAEALREEALEKIEEKRVELEEIIDSMRLDTDVFDLPDVPDIPKPAIDIEPPEPLCASSWDFAEQCRQLIASKNYEIATSGSAVAR